MILKKQTVESCTIRSLATGSFGMERYVDMTLIVPRFAASQLYSDEWVKDPIELDFSAHELTFVFPRWILENTEAGNIWLDFHKAMERNYFKLIHAGVSKEEASKCLDGYISSRVSILIPASKLLSNEAEIEFQKILGEDFYRTILEKAQGGLSK